MAGGGRQSPQQQPQQQPAAPANAGYTSAGSGLVQQLTGQMGSQGPPGQTTEQRANAQGIFLPAQIQPGTPAADAFYKAQLGYAAQTLTPDQIAQSQAVNNQPSPPVAGLPGFMPGGLPGGLPEGGLQGGLQGGLGAPGTSPALGGNSALMQALTAGLTGQGAPQAQAPPAFDPALMEIIKNQAMGVGMPTYQDIISGSFEPMSALMDQQFKTAQTDAFEQLVSRGVLQSGETANQLTRMAAELGTSKGALLGQLSLDYAKQRFEQINAAISQWGILEGQRASNAVTISTANLGAAVSIQQTAMQTLTNLTTAMAQITSAEKIAGADIASREKVAGMQIAASENIAGMQIGSQQAIAQMQTQMQFQVAQIGAQTALQIANFDNARAHEVVTANMALEGIDWPRYLSDPVYATNMTNAIAIEKDIHLAIDQANAVDRQLGSLDQAAG